MKNLLYSFLILTLIFHSSCGSEEKSEGNTSKTEDKDTLDTVADTLDMKEKLPRERLPRHTGSWIDRNLENDYFYSEKVDEKITKAKDPIQAPEGEIMDYVNDYYSAKEIKKLNIREVIYYALAYPASFSQVCAEGFYDSTAHIPKINGYIPFSFEAEELSDIQWDEINRRRDSAILVLTEYMEENPEKIDLEYLRLLKRLDAIEAFPTVMATASKENSANYSYLLEFMRENEYSPLRETDFYEKMYGEEAYFNNNSIESTPTVRKKIIELAKAFYKEMK